jgi:hypothetical protein
VISLKEVEHHLYALKGFRRTDPWIRQGKGDERWVAAYFKRKSRARGYEYRLITAARSTGMWTIEILTSETVIRLQDL